MKIGILTSGGDCPGLNAVIRGAVLKGDRGYGAECAGFRYGWRGVVEGDIMPLDRHSVRGLSRQGGTILGSSRTNPFEGDAGGPENIQRMMDENGIDAIIAIGGEGTLTAARRLTDAGLRIVGVPKTIDNDLAATDYSFGFDTAVEIATEAIDRLRTTAESHQRCMVVEVMGRHVGWIALHSGMAGGAHAILIPEQPQSIEQICEWVESVRGRGRAPGGGGDGGRPARGRERRRRERRRRQPARARRRAASTAPRPTSAGRHLRTGPGTNRARLP